MGRGKLQIAIALANAVPVMVKPFLLVPVLALLERAVGDIGNVGYQLGDEGANGINCDMHPIPHVEDLFARCYSA